MKGILSGTPICLLTTNDQHGDMEHTPIDGTELVCHMNLSYNYPCRFQVNVN